MRDLSYIRSWFAGSNPSGFYHGAVVTGGDPRTVNDPAPRNPLGILYRHWDGNVYRYVKFDWGTDHVAAMAGGCVHWKQLSYANGVFTVTSDASDGFDIYYGHLNDAAGFLGGVVTNSCYCWAQVGGIGMVLTDETDGGQLNAGVLFGSNGYDSVVSTGSSGLAVAQLIVNGSDWTGDSPVLNPVQARILIVPA